MSDFRHFMADTGLAQRPGVQALPAPARCAGCGAGLRRGVTVRGCGGPRCPACLEALAEALRAESRAADYDRYHPWGRGG